MAWSQLEQILATLATTHGHAMAQLGIGLFLERRRKIQLHFKDILILILINHERPGSSQ